MDNTSIAYEAVLRVYRNAIVQHIRDCLSATYGGDATAQLHGLFKETKSSRDGTRKMTQWDLMVESANERRQGGTGELSNVVRDDYEVLGVEHFSLVFEKFFECLCPLHAQKSKNEMKQARTVLTQWMNRTKAIRDPIGHPVTDDLEHSDAANLLYTARKSLDFLGLAVAAERVLSLEKRLLGSAKGRRDRLLNNLPPDDEVVMEFVGRHKELAELSNWLELTHASRKGLSGEGGKGKSAIAYSFARSVAARDDLPLVAVIWISAKRRRFIEGREILINRPDFCDRETAIAAISSAYNLLDPDTSPSEDAVLSLLREFPALLVVDDIDTVEAENDAAVSFLLHKIPETTPSRVLFTSRTALSGLSHVTTQVSGLSPADGESLLRSRCVLLGLSSDAVLSQKQQIFQVTDSSPLYMEDLLRLHSTGLPIEKSIGIWKERGGVDARKYSMQREYEGLSSDAKQVLLALTWAGATRIDELSQAFGWRDPGRILDALKHLRKIFLTPESKATGDDATLSLNHNTRQLVHELYSASDGFERIKRALIERNVQAVKGLLKTTVSENAEVERIRRRVRATASSIVPQPDSAEYSAQIGFLRTALEDAVNRFPGRAELFADLGWLEKRFGNRAAARTNFTRAHELGHRDNNMYWHWSDMEAGVEEWRASADAAEKGLERCGEEQGLLFLLGYALHRFGRELINELGGEAGQKECERASEILEKARRRTDDEHRNFTLKRRIYRAIALNLEALEDGAALSRHMALWMHECPDDPDRETEYERLRAKFPMFLQRH